ncbi:GNAT family N-acetyltransferase [Bradyrhizobium sp. 186]|nr:GNAT family N-acetyltransferase [Bradyrhizobium sp. 186]
MMQSWAIVIACHCMSSFELRKMARSSGGISGGTSLGLLTVNLVYLPETLRGTGIGTRMMAMAEQEARRRGCRAGVVYTINFQAPGFYQRLGWRNVLANLPKAATTTALAVYELRSSLRLN